MKETEEKERKEAKFVSVRWGKTETGEGEEAELTASVKNITDGNMVTLQVFPEGSGPENGAAYGVFPLTVKNGSVSTKWKWESDRRELPPEEDPVFVFTAHCAWCPWKKSENHLKVKLVRPEITKAEWKDTEGKTVSKGLAGEPLKLVAETKDMEEGSGVTFTVYEEKSGKKAAETGATVKDGKAEAQWIYHYNGENLTEKPRYYYEATGNRCRKAKSGTVEIGAKFSLIIQSDIDYEVYGFEVLLIKNDDEENAEKLLFSSGKIEKENIIPASYSYKLVRNESKLEQSQEEPGTAAKINTVMYTKATSRKFSVDLEKENIIFIQKNDKGVSK